MDFLLNNFVFTIHLVEILAAVVAVFCLNKYKKTQVKYFIFFIVYVAGMELVGAYPTYLNKFDFLAGIRELLDGTKIERNFWFYTIFWKIGGVLFYSRYFKKLLRDTRFIKIINILGFVFLVTSIFYIAINWDLFFTSGLNLISLFGAFIILLSVVLYFIEMLKSTRILNFYRSVNFYIGGVLIIFYLVRTPLIFYNAYFSRSDYEYLKLYATINILCIIFMYLTYAIALLWCKPENN